MFFGQCACCDEGGDNDAVPATVVLEGGRDDNDSTALTEFTAAVPTKSDVSSATWEPLTMDTDAKVEAKTPPMNEDTVNEDTGDAEVPAEEQERRWEVVISRTEPTQKLGMVVEQASDKYFCVMAKPKEGLIAEWNKDQRSRAVGAGDVLLAVNGSPATDFDALEMLKTEDNLRLQFKRYPKFTATVEKEAHEPHGLGAVTQGDRTLRVKSIEGIMKKRNVDARAGLELIPGDIIESVNGVTGSPEQLEERLKMPDTRVQLVLRRPG